MPQFTTEAGPPRAVVILRIAALYGHDVSSHVGLLKIASQMKLSLERPWQRVQTGRGRKLHNKRLVIRIILTSALPENKDDSHRSRCAACLRGETTRSKESARECHMGALGWTIYESEGLVVVRGVGVLDLPFMTSFREAMRAEGAAGYSKLFDLSRADIQLSSDDLQTMAARTRLSDPVKSGPIAIILGAEPSPLLVDMAILMKSRIGSRRRLRLFTNEAEAILWLATETNQPSSARVLHYA